LRFHRCSSKLFCLRLDNGFEEVVRFEDAIGIQRGDRHSNHKVPQR
jgi:hypothetical protein